jgi:hypothetical protein
MADSVKVNVTIDNRQLAEINFIPVGKDDWSARVAVLLPDGLKMMQIPVPSFPDDLNVMGLILSVVSRLPKEAFVGPVDPPDMEGRFTRTLPEIQARPSKLRDNRSSLWRR